MAKRMTIQDLKTFVANYVAANNTGTKTPGTSADSVVTHLLQKIWDTIVLDGDFNDYLAFLDGPEVKGQVEEMYANLIQPVSNSGDYWYSDGSGDSADDELSPNRPDMDIAYYNTPLDKVRFKTTIDQYAYDQYINGGNIEVLVVLLMKRLNDSYQVFKTNAKIEALKVLAEKAIAIQAGTGATAYTTNSTVLAQGTVYSQSGAYYQCIKSASAALNFTLAQLCTADATHSAYVVKCEDGKLVKTMADVTDTATGEAFSLELMNTASEIKFKSEGTSLSGSTIGAVPGRKLTVFIKPGTLNAWRTSTLSGSLGPQYLEPNVNFVEVEGFNGAGSDKVWAIAVDDRILRLCPMYFNVKSTECGAGNYINYFLHFRGEVITSTHCFVKVFKTA